MPRCFESIGGAELPVQGTIAVFALRNFALLERLLSIRDSHAVARGAELAGFVDGLRDERDTGSTAAAKSVATTITGGWSVTEG